MRSFFSVFFSSSKTIAIILLFSLLQPFQHHLNQSEELLQNAATLGKMFY